MVSFVQKQNGVLIIVTWYLCHIIIYLAAWQVTRNALYFLVFKVMQILASLQVAQRFSVQLSETPSQFFQHSKSKPPYTEKYITNKAKKQLANISWLE